MVAPIIDHNKAATKKAADMYQKRICASGTYQTLWLKATTTVVALMIDHRNSLSRWTTRQPAPKALAV